LNAIKSNNNKLLWIIPGAILIVAGIFLYVQSRSCTCISVDEHMMRCHCGNSPQFFIGILLLIIGIVLIAIGLKAPAIVAVIVGISGIILSFIGLGIGYTVLLGGLLGLFSIIIGSLSLTHLFGTRESRSKAISGIILGTVALAIAILVGCIWVAMPY